MNATTAPQIQTERLLIDELRLHDASAMYLYRSTPEVMRYQTWHPTSEKEVRAFIRKTNRIGFNSMDSWFQFGIYQRGTTVLVGDVGIHFLSPDNRQVEIGFSISPNHQRKGYASEAVQALLGYLFENLKKHRVIASVDPSNIGSIKLLEKVGMRMEGHFRQSIWTGKVWADDLIYGLLDAEWNEKHKQYAAWVQP